MGASWLWGLGCNPKHAYLELCPLEINGMLPSKQGQHGTVKHSCWWSERGLFSREWMPEGRDSGQHCSSSILLELLMKEMLVSLLLPDPNKNHHLFKWFRFVEILICWVAD